MTEPVGGIDPHQDTFTVGIVDHHGVEITHDTFPNTATGYGAAIDLLDAHGVRRVGVEGSAKWGAHVAVALCAAGFDAREVPASRSAAQRRSRRLEKTDAVDAVASARALLAEPTLGPVQALEAYDPAVAEIEAVLEHRRTLVAARTLMLHHVGDQIAELPTEVRDQLTTTGKIEARPLTPRRNRPRHSHDPSGPAPARLAAGVHRPGPHCSQRDPPIGASHRRAARPSRHHLARRARHRPHRSRHPAVRGRRPDPVRPRVEIRTLVPPPAPSPCPQARATATRSSTGSTSEATGASTLSCTSRRSPSSAASPKPSPTSPEKPANPRPDAKPDEPTNANSPTASSAECGATKPPESNPSRSPLDKGASDRPKR